MNMKRHLLLGGLAVGMPLLAVTVALTSRTGPAPAPTSAGITAVAANLPASTSGRLPTADGQEARPSQAVSVNPVFKAGIPATEAADVLLSATGIESGETRSVTPVDIDGVPAWRVEVQRPDGTITIGHVDLLSGSVLGWETRQPRTDGAGSGANRGTEQLTGRNEHDGQEHEDD